MPKNKKGKKPTGKKAKGNFSNKTMQKVTKKQRRNQEYLDYAKHIGQFNLQLSSLNLTIKDVKGDGNCMFRAISDQLYGNEKAHEELRKMAVQYMHANPDEFAPFVIDDYDYEEYLEEMSKDGEWGGNLELHAISRKLNVNIVLHMRERPAMVILVAPNAKILHLAYHLGEHYSSVRMIGDEKSLDPPKNIPSDKWIPNELPEFLSNQTSNELFEAKEQDFVENYIDDPSDLLVKELQEEEELFKMQMEELKISCEEEKKIDKCSERKNQKFEIKEKKDSSKKGDFEEKKSVPEKEKQKNEGKSIIKMTEKEFKEISKNTKCICNSKKKFKNCCSHKSYSELLKEHGIQIIIEKNPEKSDAKIQDDLEKVKFEKPILI